MEAKRLPLHPLDLPYLKAQPTAEVLLAALDSLALAPPSWDRPVTTTAAPVPLISGDAASGDDPAFANWLTRLVGSDLWWIDDDAMRERIQGLAATRLAERCGRSAAPAMTRTFHIPCMTSISEDGTAGTISITLHEPPLVSDSLGLKTWGSSYLLSKRLHHLVPSVLPAAEADRPLRALELGSGTGLVGLSAAMLFGWDMHLTDLPDVVPNLARNIASNLPMPQSMNVSSPPAVVAKVLDWTAPLADNYWSDKVESFDVVLASDPLYTPQHPELVVSCVSLFLRKPRSSSDIGGKFILEHPLRPTHMEEVADCESRLQAAGLVRETGGEEVGWDDWGTNSRDLERLRLQEGEDVDVEALGGVRCRWSVWHWRQQ